VGTTSTIDCPVSFKRAMARPTSARAREMLGHEEASTTARHYRRGVVKVTPLR